MQENLFFNRKNLNNQVLNQLDNLIWLDVPDVVKNLAEKAAGTYSVIQDLIIHLPNISSKIWYSPDKEEILFNYPPDSNSDKVAEWHISLKQIPEIQNIKHGVWLYPKHDVPYIQIKSATSLKSIFEPVGQLTQFRPSFISDLYGGPNPLAATLAGGLLGAGLGYGGGWLAEQILPEDYFEKGHLRRTGTLLGSLGAIPGLALGIDNMRGQVLPENNSFLRAWITPHPMQINEYKIEKPASALVEQLSSELCELNEQFVKCADNMGADFVPRIPVDQFNRTIWNDLRSYGGSTPPDLAAATTGLVQAASLSRGGVDLVSPYDIAKIGIGAGSGWLSGMLVGKTLGALAGLKPQTQETLQNTGVWAGVLSNTVPLLFGK